MNDSLTADGFDSAFMGYIDRCGQPKVAIYDKDAVLEILMDRGGMTPDEALEYFDYNIQGAWIGDGTPGFIETCKIGVFREICKDE